MEVSILVILDLPPEQHLGFSGNIANNPCYIGFASRTACFFASFRIESYL